MIFAIESSCDEVSASLVRPDFQVVNNILYSSAHIASTTGGVVPEVAARKAEQNIVTVLQKSLIGIHPQNDITAIAVTNGYGLLGSLLTGIEAAKTLSFLWNKPLIPVFHTFGHMCANMLLRDEGIFPRLVLTISGGHNDIMLWHSPLHWERIGKTIDDAAGECFDKCARMLGLGYPGGPALSKLAATAEHDNAFSLPRPMLHHSGLDMSFSGLKTAVLYSIASHGGIENFSDTQKANLAASIEQAIVDVVLGKLSQAAKHYAITTIEITGGVSANRRIRTDATRLSQKKNWTLRFPEKIEFCTDNAAMIAAAGNIIWKYSSEKKFHFSMVQPVLRS